jgi:DDE superfamily endonuclease
MRRRARHPGATTQRIGHQKVLYDAKRHAHTAQGLAVSTIWGDLLWCDGGWPGCCHEQELVELSGLRALVEQSIGHLANAWALRRWQGLLYRVRDVYRAAAALICLGRWLHRVTT